MEELKCLLTAYMDRTKGSNHGSPSVSKSVLENPISSSIPALEAAPVLPNIGHKCLSTNATLIAEDPSAQQKEHDMATIHCERDMSSTTKEEEVLKLV